jgi:hypothetical protein
MLWAKLPRLKQSMPARHNEARPGERFDTEDEEVVEGLGVVASGVGRLDGVEHHLAQDRLGRDQGEALPFPAFRWFRRRLLHGPVGVGGADGGRHYLGRIRAGRGG